MKRITSTDLAKWAPTRDCQEHFPLLIRRLVKASSITIVKMLFPAGDNVILPGYDGILETLEGTQYIPFGHSVWELGSGKEFKEKAENDYNKRTQKVSITESANTTFIFVTPYIWLKKDEWAREKRETQSWKTVQVIDGLILEEWIETLPAIGAWLAKFLQMPLANIEPLDEFWNIWSKSLKHSISSTLVVSARETEMKRLTDFLIGIPGILTLKSSTTEEAIAFIAACIERIDADVKETIYARAIIIESEQDFKVIASLKSPMILLAKFETGTIIDQAVRNGHHVILPISNDMTSAKTEDIELPRIQRSGFEKGLEEMGFNSEEIEKLIRDSGQSLSVLRRLLQFERNRQPAWAKDGYHADMIPALLAGMWNEESEEDKVILSLLAGEPYDKYISRLSRWKIAKDAPVFQVRSIWRVTSALDAWSILARFLTKTDLDNFKASFLAALQEINPALELEVNQRYLASFYGTTLKYSNAIKEGLCQSLILLGIFGERFELDAIDSPQNFADKLVYELLDKADSQKWCSLERILPLLAEASPNSFLTAVERSLGRDDSPILAMFRKTDNLLNSTSYYTGLLWALENLVYSSEYLLRATLILGHLSRLDPGGKLSNRPINSLKEIYNPWYNQIDADFLTRQNVLNKLLQKEPNIAWELFLNIAPKKRIVVLPIHRCRWRFDTQHLERSVTYQQIWDFHSFLFDQLIFLAAGNEDRIAALISLYPKVNLNEREKLLRLLKENRNAIHDRNTIIWDELRKLLSKHREHCNLSWALTSEELDKLETIFNLYTPLGDKKRYLYLFEESYPTLPEGLSRKKLSQDERQKIVREKRISNFKEVYEKEGLEGILKIINDLTNSLTLARTAADFNLSEKDEATLFKLINKDQTDKFTSFTQNYLFAKALSTDKEWIKWAWETVKSFHSDPETISYFFLHLPQGSFTWDLLNTASCVSVQASACCLIQSLLVEGLPVMWEKFFDFIYWIIR